MGLPNCDEYFPSAYCILTILASMYPCISMTSCILPSCILYGFLPAASQSDGW